MSFAGSIAFFSGDNLGSQLIGGFKEGSDAALKCRHCMGTSDAIQTTVKNGINLESIEASEILQLTNNSLLLNQVQIFKGNMPQCV